MRSLFDLEEANTILSALSDMDDFFLPKSISRKDLYTLVRKFADTMGLRISENGEIPLPNLFRDKFDVSKSIEIGLTQIEIDYVICALHAMNFEGTGYPVNINLAASRAYNKANAQFKDGMTDNQESETWEIVIQNKELAGSKE